MGSPAAASLIAQAAFWGLLLLGCTTGGLSWGRTLAFLLLWLAGWAGLSYAPYGSAVFTPFVAVLDIALVFVVCRGDVKLT